MPWVSMDGNWHYVPDTVEDDSADFHSADEMHAFYSSDMTWDKRIRRFRPMITVELPEYDD